MNVLQVPLFLSLSRSVFFSKTGTALNWPINGTLNCRKCRYTALTGDILPLAWQRLQERNQKHIISIQNAKKSFFSPWWKASTKMTLNMPCTVCSLDLQQWPGRDVDCQMLKHLSRCGYFSLQFDESLAIMDTAQLVVFVKMAFPDSTTKKAFLTLLLLVERTTGEDIYNVVGGCWTWGFWKEKRKGSTQKVHKLNQCWMSPHYFTTSLVPQRAAKTPAWLRKKKKNKID